MTLFALKSPGLSTDSVLYRMVLKVISLGYGVPASHDIFIIYML